MSELDTALDRLSEAVAELIAEPDQSRSAPADIAELIAERDRLRGEVDELRALREDDDRLHEDAAEAVRLALADLRGLVAGQE